MFTQPDSAEEALDMVHDLAATGEVRLIVIDSVTALLPKAEEDADMEQNTIGLQARLLSKAMRKLKGVLAKNKCTAIFINQVREKVGAYGNPETTSGGRALRFYASLRVEVRRGDVLGSKEEPIGHTAKVKIVKNKVASPYKTADFDIYSVGDIAIDPIRSTINLAVELGVMTKGGSWIYYPDKENPLVINGDQCKWQSMQKAIDAIRSNLDIYSAIYNDIMAIAKKDNEDFVPEDDNEEGENENE